MSSEYIQRQVEFIIEQQAKFEVNIGKLEEQNKANAANIAKLGEIILSLANYNQQQDELIAAHDRQIANNERQIAALIEAGKETDERFRETNERLNSVISLAERFSTEAAEARMSEFHRIAKRKEL